MHRLLLRLKQLPKWLFLETKEFWLAFLVPGMILLLTASLPYELGNDLHVRAGGYLLFLLGIVNIVLGISDTRKLFGRPSLTARTISWWKRNPLIARSTTVSVGFGTTASAGFHASVGRGVVTGRTLEDRLAILETRVENLQVELTSARAEIKEETRVLGEKIELERRDREIGDKKALEVIEEVAAGGLDLEMAGLVWLVVAELLLTFPTEVGTLLH